MNSVSKITPLEVFLIHHIVDAKDIFTYFIPATSAVEEYIITHTRRKANTALITDLKDFNDKLRVLVKEDIKAGKLKDIPFRDFDEEVLNINANGVIYGRTADAPGADPEMLISDKLIAVGDALSLVLTTDEGRVQSNRINIVGYFFAESSTNPISSDEHLTD